MIVNVHDRSEVGLIEISEINESVNKKRTIVSKVVKKIYD